LKNLALGQTYAVPSVGKLTSSGKTANVATGRPEIRHLATSLPFKPGKILTARQSEVDRPLPHKIPPRPNSIVLSPDQKWPPGHEDTERSCCAHMHALVFF